MQPTYSTTFQPTNRPTRQLAIQPTSLPSPRQPSNSLTSPPPRVLTSPTRVHAITPTTPKVRIHDLCPTTTGKPTTMPAHTKQQTYSLPIVEPDNDRDEMPTTRSSTKPRCSTRLITNRTPCNISCQALYHIIGLGFTNAPAYTVPDGIRF